MELGRTKNLVACTRWHWAVSCPDLLLKVTSKSEEISAAYGPISGIRNTVFWVCDLFPILTIEIGPLCRRRTRIEYD